MKRKSWDDYWIDMVQNVATRSTCDRLHVGAILVKDNRMISSGYNGSVKGQCHCTNKSTHIEEGGCLNDEGRCVRTIHAEVNALLHAPRHEIEGSTCYATDEPCENCTKLLVQSGVKRVVFLRGYKNKYNQHFVGDIEWQQYQTHQEVINQ